MCLKNSNQSQFAAASVNLPGTKLAPFSKSSGPVELEIVAFVEVALLIEIVVN